MVIDKVKAEFGRVELFGVVLERNTELAGIAGLLVAAVVAVDRTGDIKRPEIYPANAGLVWARC